MNKPDTSRAPSGEEWKITPLASFPPPEKWHDWTEYDSASWPKKVEKHYQLVPTTCFNCEAACGLVAYIDKETNKIRKLEGNPYHPGSRGRNCAKGPATVNQVSDEDRILYPMKRVGPRGEAQFERTTWDEVIKTLAGRIRKAIQEKRLTEVMYHVGRPGADGYMDRVLQSWGVDGHNSHTNVCSGAARLGYALWSGMDRPSPDHAHAKFILLISSHLETGHYFNPHAQRIIEAKMKGAKIATVDIRLSNTASMSDYWIAPHPGTEAAMLLGFCRLLLEEDLFDHDFVRRWVNWKTYLTECRSDLPVEFESFISALKEQYAEYTPEWVEQECGVPAKTIIDVGREIGAAQGAFASHVWRNAASGNRGGWQVSRCLQFLSVLTGSVGTKGGTAMAATNKFVAAPFTKPSPQQVWSELLYPPEWPLSHHELSFCLPHLLRDGRGKIDTYFTRVYNPVWTNPDGFAWIEMLKDEKLVGMHAAMTPVWNETALWADYVLPMGLAPERHDLVSQETHAAKWVSFRQPVLRVAADMRGEETEWTYETNPGEVWEEDEFWIALSWAIDPDGSLGIRKNFESPYREGERITIAEYYRWIFDHSIPGLPEAAAKENQTPYEYMRTHGCFEVVQEVYTPHENAVSSDGATKDADDRWIKDGKAVGVDIDGKALAGFPTPSRKLEFFSPTMREWGLEEHSLPGYIKSHIHPSNIDRSKNEFALVPTFRIPTLIHTRSNNAKWLYEISNNNPVWIGTEDAKGLGVITGDLLRVTTASGYFVNRAWVTEGIRPGVVACSHHLGRWRQKDGQSGGDRMASVPVDIQGKDGQWLIRRTGDIEPYESNDPDTKRIWWNEGGVHQNLTFSSQPDPISGMHCWHHKVTVTKAEEGDRYGDVFADVNKSYKVFQEWMAASPMPKSKTDETLRRPLWFARAVKPAESAYYKKKD